MTTSPSKVYGWPVIGPLLALLSMQEFMLTLLTLGLNYLITVRPELEASRLELHAVVTALFLLLISGQLAERLRGHNASSFWRAAFGPISLLIRSRKFQIGAATLLANVIIALIPETESYRAEMIASFTAIALALIGGIAYEDGKAKEGLPLAVTASVPDTSSLPNMNLPAGFDLDRFVEFFELILRQKGYTIIPSPK